MRLVRDGTWARRGLTLLWGPAQLLEVSTPSSVLSVRQFFAMARAWPEDLPGNGGRALVIAGVEGCLDVLTPADSERWLEEELRPRVLSFQEEYESQSALVLWLPEGRQRVQMTRSTESYLWKCGPPSHGQTLPLGRVLWGGAESDVGRILDPNEKNTDFDGPAWVGLHHPRIS